MLFRSINPHQPKPQDPQEHPRTDPLTDTGAAAQSGQSQKAAQPLLPEQLCDKQILAWCAEALPTDHARSVFYTLLYYGLSQHNTTPPDLVAWAKNQQEQYGGF